MKYYVVADVHGFFKEMKKALKEKGFFDDKEPHKLIVCGDMLDRGKEAVEMEAFMLDLLHKDELIFIRGNHEDLMVEMVENFDKHMSNIYWGYSHHVSNGTWDSALQLAHTDQVPAFKNVKNLIELVTKSSFYSELLKATVDYFETDKYIFVHGWIPCLTEDMPAHYRKNRTYNYNPNWRRASKKSWNDARWFNGMELALKHKILEPDKTIVCGHWHTSYGHSLVNSEISEFEEDADFSVFEEQGIIALDACTAHSGFVNCIVIED